MNSTGDKERGWQAKKGVSLPFDLKELLEAMAARENITFSAMVRQLITEAIEARKRKKE